MFTSTSLMPNDHQRLKQLYLKYLGKGRRYSYYPHLSHWNGDLTGAQQFEEGEIDLYIHIPFCRKLCTFCGCNVKVTNSPGEALPYVEALGREWELVQEKFGHPSIRNLYLGGGTPTFLEPLQLEKLINSVFRKAKRSPDFRGHLESDPRIKQTESLKILAGAGFTNISIGVQDFNSDVLINVNREQSRFQVAELISSAREIGFENINCDMLYGLPFQNPEKMANSFSQLIKMSPDTVAFYPLAHVPWQKGHQEAYGEFKLPSDEEKLELFLTGHKILEEDSYHYQGMGHYFKNGSQLHIAAQNKNLGRHISGFFDTKASKMIGLGVSSLSNWGNALTQNQPIISKYFRSLEMREIPWINGHLKTQRERELETEFERLSCGQKAQLELPGKWHREGFISSEADGSIITPLGRHFLRPIFETLDPLLNRPN